MRHDLLKERPCKAEKLKWANHQLPASDKQAVRAVVIHHNPVPR
jgi:hypothetical protein